MIRYLSQFEACILLIDNINITYIEISFVNIEFQSILPLISLSNSSDE
jgi:hypothetical protein